MFTMADAQPGRLAPESIVAMGLMKVMPAACMAVTERNDLRCNVPAQEKFCSSEEAGGREASPLTRHHVLSNGPFV